MLLIPTLLFHVLSLPLFALSKSTIEPCSVSDSCNALVGYTLYTDLKISEVAAHFQVDPIAILNANAIDISIPDINNSILPAGLFLKIPIICSCADGIRKAVSTHYKARPSVTLSSIADAGLASPDPIREANTITNPSVLDVDPTVANIMKNPMGIPVARAGDILAIPLPDIFGLSSLLRQLIGEGSHRQLVTTMVFHHHPKFTHFVKEHSCEAIVVEYLPTGVFSDPFELQRLVGREVFLSASVLGDTNLELPSALSNRSAVEIHVEVKSDAHKVVVPLPLHSRYPPLDSSGYSNVTIGNPDLFMRCRPKSPQAEACLWTLIDLGFSSGSNVTWTIPCGYEAHTKPVTIVTFLSALICSLLIVLSTHYKKNKSKLE